jgi:4'-phosphopantetheinyl transferase
MLSLTYLQIDGPAADRLIADFATAADLRSVERHAQERRRRQGLTARALLRAMLERLTGRNWSLVKNDQGKLELAAPSAGAAPWISVSHSGDLVACAVSGTGSTGIDVEKLRPDRDCVGLAGAAFAPSEVEAVRRGGCDAFYRIWTLREALFKAAGMAGSPPVTTSPCRIGADLYDIAYWPLGNGYGLAAARHRSEGVEPDWRPLPYQ